MSLLLNISTWRQWLTYPSTDAQAEAIIFHLDAVFGESEMGQKALQVSHAAAL